MNKSGLCLPAPKSMVYSLQNETREVQAKIPANSVDAQSHSRGSSRGEPLIVMMDALLRYAKAYQKRYDNPIAEDEVIGVTWIIALDSVRALLNGDGAVAMEEGYTTDSKCNGALESLYHIARESAGFPKQ